MTTKSKASIELTLLVSIMSVFILSVGIYGILEIRKLNENSKELYSNRLIPMGHLSRARFHAFTILSTIHEAETNKIPYSDALSKISKSQDSLLSSWRKYSASYLTSGEQQTAAKTAVLIQKFDTDIEILKTALAKDDAYSLNRVLRNRLNISSKVAVAGLNELIEMQIQIGKDINEHGTSLYFSYTEKFFWILLLALAFGGASLYYLIKRNQAIFRKINIDDTKLFLTERNYRNLIEYAGETVLILNEEAEIIDLNDYAVKLLGYSREELLCMKVSDLVAEEDRKQQAKDLNSIRKETFGVNYRRIRKKDGTFIETEISKRFMEGRGFFAIIRDITERKRIESELMESKEQLRLFIKHSPASLAMFDTEMRYIATSCRWIVDYNLAEQDIIGKTHYEVFPEIGQEWKDIHQRCLTGIIEKRDEDSFMRTDGSTEWLQWEIRPWHKSSGEIGGIIMFTEVITERKNQERELVRYNNELRKTNAELDRFVYSASHDLRAPLKSILGLINITTKDIKQKKPKDDFQAKMLERLHMLDRSATKLDNFIDDILDYSRNARLETESNEIDFDDLVRDLNSNFKFINKQKVDFTVILNSEEKFVTDQKRLSIIMNNIISNAYKYSDNTKKNPFIKVIFNCNKDKATIVVKDNGIGIDDTDKERLFDMFYRSATSSTGSGLGLYIVREAVEKLNGTYSVHSELGIGSEFCIEIPNK